MKEFNNKNRHSLVSWIAESFLAMSCAIAIVAFRSAKVAWSFVASRFVRGSNGDIGCVTFNRKLYSWSVAFVGSYLFFAVSLPLGLSRVLAEEKEAKRPMLNVVPMPAFPQAAVVALKQDRGDWFESWVFGGMSASSARKRLENSYAQRIVLLKQQCNLTDEQVSKLELGKRGDIARFFQQFDAVRLNVGEQRPDRANMAELAKAIGPIQQRWNSGLLGNDSLFVSMLRNLLSEEQKASLSQEGKRRIEERSRFHAMSMIKMIEHSIPLTEKQRQRLLELVIEQTTKVRVDAHLEQYTSLHATTQLSDEVLGSFLDASQLTTFRQLQKHWETNIPFLNQMVKQPGNDGVEEWMDVIQ